MMLASEHRSIYQKSQMPMTCWPETLCTGDTEACTGENQVHQGIWKKQSPRITPMSQASGGIQGQRMVEFFFFFFLSFYWQSKYIFL